MSIARFIQRDLDLGLITTVLAATTIGITMIYSATFDWDLGTASTTYQKQILWAFIALAGLALTIVIPPKL